MTRVLIVLVLVLGLLVELVLRIALIAVLAVTVIGLVLLDDGLPDIARPALLPLLQSTMENRS